MFDARANRASVVRDPLRALDLRAWHDWHAVIAGLPLCHHRRFAPRAAAATRARGPHGRDRAARGGERSLANGRTVAEVLGERVTLAGKTIRVQATVMKVTTGVLGRTYLHVRDGSGDATKGTHDLTVTTAATPAVGQVITIEGVVALDREVGAGYSFPTLIENARVL